MEELWGGRSIHSWLSSHDIRGIGSNVVTDKKTILLIDDDQVVIKVLSKALRQEGYEVIEETRDFDNIIDKIRSTYPDVTLLDISLRGLNGLDILNEMKQQNIGTPVIMLTGDFSADTAVKSTKLGAEDYLTKPCDLEEMKMVINNVLEKVSLKQESQPILSLHTSHKRKA